MRARAAARPDSRAPGSRACLLYVPPIERPAPPRMMGPATALSSQRRWRQTRMPWPLARAAQRRSTFASLSPARRQENGAANTHDWTHRQLQIRSSPPLIRVVYEGIRISTSRATVPDVLLTAVTFTASPTPPVPAMVETDWVTGAPCI
jgi:hypothetical protein